MLHKEFEELTGMKVDEATFQGIHEMYMMAGDDISKEEFCQAYKFMSSRTSTMRVMLGIYKTAKELDTNNNELVKLYTDAKQEQKYQELIIFLVDQAHELFSMDLRNKAIEMLGEKGKAKYIKMCLEREYELWGIDKKALMDIL